MAKLNMKTLAEELAALRAQISALPTGEGTVTPEITGAAKAAEERQANDGLTFVSVNLGRVSEKWDTAGTKFVSACLVGGENDGKWIGLVFFKSRLSVPLATGMFLRVGIAPRHHNVFNVGWAE